MQVLRESYGLHDVMLVSGEESRHVQQWKLQAEFLSEVSDITIWTYYLVSLSLCKLCLKNICWNLVEKKEHVFFYILNISIVPCFLSLMTTKAWISVLITVAVSRFYSEFSCLNDGMEFSFFLSLGVGID